tara:strand:+ start:250 stop:834 length:585 start_codon:yes stop_codon:yes gene_type:complete
VIRKKLKVKRYLNQSGFTLLELLTVIGMLLVLTTFVTPVIGKWRTEKNIEKDFYALVSAINYLKSKAQVVNGTGYFNCNASRSAIYSVSGFAQTSVTSKHANFDANIIEQKSENILSGKTYFDCGGGSGGVGTILFFLQNGKATPWIGEISYDPEPGIPDKVNYSAYQIRLNNATGFVQQFKWNKKSESWTELR